MQIADSLIEVRQSLGCFPTYTLGYGPTPARNSINDSIAIAKPSAAVSQFVTDDARHTLSAGINRHVVGGASPYGKGESDSILASSLAGGIVRCRLKRRQRDRWARLLSFVKRVDQDADCMVCSGKAIRRSR